MVRSYELGVLCLPSLEAAYLQHPHRGFNCTEQVPSRGFPGGIGGVTEGGAVQVGGGSGPPRVLGNGASREEEFAAAGMAAVAGEGREGQGEARVDSGRVVGSSSSTAAAAECGGAENQGGVRVRFFAWGQSGLLEEQRENVSRWGGSDKAAIGGVGVANAGGCGQKQQQQGLLELGACGAGCREVLVPLPVPYKLPPEGYRREEDKPWMVDVLYPGMDVLGHTRGEPVHLYGRIE